MYPTSFRLLVGGGVAVTLASRSMPAGAIRRKPWPSSIPCRARARNGIRWSPRWSYKPAC